jgi:hypothetical protein
MRRGLGGLGTADADASGVCPSDGPVIELDCLSREHSFLFRRSARLPARDMTEFVFGQFRAGYGIVHGGVAHDCVHHHIRE